MVLTILGRENRIVRLSLGGFMNPVSIEHDDIDSSGLMNELSRIREKLFTMQRRECSPLLWIHSVTAIARIFPIH